MIHNRLFRASFTDRGAIGHFFEVEQSYRPFGSFGGCFRVTNVLIQLQRHNDDNETIRLLNIQDLSVRALKSILSEFLSISSVHDVQIFMAKNNRAWDATSDEQPRQQQTSQDSFLADDYIVDLLRSWPEPFEYQRRSYVAIQRKERRQDCSCCFSSKRPSEFPEKLHAAESHDVYTCKECVGDWISSQLSGSTWDRIKCPECPEILQYADVQSFATKETFEQ